MLSVEELVASFKAEAKPRVDPKAAKFDPEIIRRHLTPAQRAVFECDAPAINVLGGRQGGKTFTLVGWLFEGAFEKPGTLNPYFALTAESVGRIMWPEVMAWVHILKIPPECVREHTHSVRLPNGSMIVGTGTDDKRKIETWRGVKAYRLALDEMGAQSDSFIRYFVAMLWPTLIKNKGRMLRSGNPGLILNGYWFDQTNDNRAVDVPLFHWTAWDNPHLGTHEEVDEFVDAALRDEGVDRTSVVFEREWLALWREDAGALVYPYKHDRNGADKLPTYNANGFELREKDWRYIIVGDPAGKGKTGIAVCAAHPDLHWRYVVQSEKHEAMLAPHLAMRFRDLQRDYPNALLMLDSGGLGSVHALEFTQIYGLPVEAAVKTEKPSAIRIFRDELISGRIRVLDGPQNDAIRKEWAALGWDAKMLQHNKDHEDHCADAALYGMRRLRDWVRSEPTNATVGPDPLHDALKAARIRAMYPSGREHWDR